MTYVLKDFSTLKKLDDFKKELVLAYAEITRIRSELQIQNAMKVIYDKVQETCDSVKNLADTVAQSESSHLETSKSIVSVIENQLSSSNEIKLNDSYASIAAKKLKFSSSPAQAVMIQQAVMAAADKPEREKSVVFKNLPTEKDQLQNELIKESGNANLTFLWLGQKDSPTALKVKTASKEEALKLLRAIPDLRKIPTLAKLSARPDYNQQELQVFRSLWKEAMTKNNEANSFLWTVRNLKLVKNQKPSTWSTTPLQA